MPRRAPGRRPEQAADDEADDEPGDEGRPARVDAGAELLGDGDIQQVRGVRAEQDRDEDPGEERQRHGASDASRSDGPQHGGGTQQDQRLGAQEDAPAHRPEQPLPEEQRRADRDEERHEDERPDRDPGGDGDGLDLAADLGRLGAGQVDVGPDERDDRVTGGAQLTAQARRAAAGCRPRPTGRAGRVVRARRVRISLERTARRAGFGRGRASSGVGRSGSSGRPPEVGWAVIGGPRRSYQRPLLRPAVHQAPQPRSRLTVTRRSGAGETLDPGRMT